MHLSLLTLCLKSICLKCYCCNRKSREVGNIHADNISLTFFSSLLHNHHISLIFKWKINCGYQFYYHIFSLSGIFLNATWCKNQKRPEDFQRTLGELELTGNKGDKNRCQMTEKKDAGTWFYCRNYFVQNVSMIILSFITWWFDSVTLIFINWKIDVILKNLIMTCYVSLQCSMFEIGLRKERWKWPYTFLKCNDDWFITNKWDRSLRLIEVSTIKVKYFF